MKGKLNISLIQWLTNLDNSKAIQVDFDVSQGTMYSGDDGFTHLSFVLIKIQ